MSASGVHLRTTYQQLGGISTECVLLELECSACESWTKVTCYCESGKERIALHTTILNCMACGKRLVEYDVLLAARAAHRMGASLDVLAGILYLRGEQLPLL